MFPSSPGSENIGIATDSTDRVPLRFWWLRRIVGTTVLVLVVVACTRGWWGAHASIALQAEIDRIRAAGEPVDSTDFELPPVRDDRNAAIPLIEAADLQNELDGRPPRASPWPPLAGLPPSLDPTQREAHAVRGMLERARQARLRTDVCWRKPGDTDPVSASRVLIPQSLLLTLQVSAVQAHRRGDDRAAVEILHDLLAVGKHVGLQRAMRGALFHRRSIDCVVDALGTILPDLKGAPGEQILPARPADLESLCRALLDEASLQQAMFWGLAAERTLHIQVARAGSPREMGLLLGATPLDLSETGFALIRPAFVLDGVRMIRHDEAWIEALSVERLPQFASPARRRVDPGLRMQSRILSLVVLPDHGHLIERLLETRARSRMAAAALAARLYEQQNGQLPQSLEDLVPRYLPKIPDDPLAAAGTIRYVTAPNPFLACSRPGHSLLFSVGSGYPQSRTRPSDTATRPPG